MSFMYMRIPLAFAALSFMPLATGSAIAHPREISAMPNVHNGHHKPVKIATASDDDAPRVRIRGDHDGKGLTPRGFSRWISRHPSLVPPQSAETSLRVLASADSQRRNAAAIFDIADANQDGRVSADELADFLTRNAPPRVPSDAT